jgi:hypothetical protein
MLAKQSPQMAFTSLNHYLDRDWLREAFHRTRKERAMKPGRSGFPRWKTKCSSVRS